MRKTFTAVALMCSLGLWASRVTQNFDFGWKFVNKDEGEAVKQMYDDKAWQSVSLPHDWDFFHSPTIDAAPGNDGGYYPGGVGWYRKKFATPKGERVMLRFEGVYQNCTVYVNGNVVGSHGYGYTPFAVDITRYLAVKGTNVIAVRVDNSKQPNCRWYSGSGIYRHVWLETTDKVHIADDGVFVTITFEKSASGMMSFAKAKVNAAVALTNSSEKERTLTVTAWDTSEQVTLGAGETKEVNLHTSILNPTLWSPATPFFIYCSCDSV